MTRPFLLLILLFGLLSFVRGEENQSLFMVEGNQTQAEKIEKKSAFVIPVRDQIGPPILDILRRGMKEAIERQVDLIILDMDTPGGELGVTLEIMQEILDSLKDWGR
jgi:membrane-bound ClpP family serine protease